MPENRSNRLEEMTPRRDLSNFQFGLGLLGVYLAWLVMAYIIVELLTHCPPTLFPTGYECRGDPLALTFWFMIVPGFVLGSVFAIACVAPRLDQTD